MAILYVFMITQSHVIEPNDIYILGTTTFMWKQEIVWIGIEEDLKIR